MREFKCFYVKDVHEINTTPCQTKYIKFEVV